MLAVVYACALVGLDGYMIEVQVDYNPKAGLPTFTIVGLPDSAVRESRERVRSAIKNSRLRFPNKGYVVNLSPADLPKHGPAYDLAIAIGVLAATDQIPMPALDNTLFIGELSLDGRINHVKGVMPMTYAAIQNSFQSVHVPVMDAPQAALNQDVAVYPVETLGQLVEHLYDLNRIEPYQPDAASIAADNELPVDLVDFADVKGQEHVKRALEIAAAGNHNVRMVGPPGVGKSLLARAMPGIMPLMTREEALEVTRIYSVADMIDASHPLKRNRSFRAPHHTISQAGLVGGGTLPKPGEVSLAHLGVLFLDEINEFGPRSLEVLRQPLEDKEVTISRAKGSLTFPANFQLIAAHNPCPCGYYGDSTRECTCTPTMIKRYEARLSGPLLDRIDIHVTVPRVDYDKLMGADRAESSATIRERVQAARQLQSRRFANMPGVYANADMSVGDVQRLCVLTPEAKQVLELSVRRMQLSARAYHRVLKLSRTIADLAGSEYIEVSHVAESLQYRPQNER
ncbi:MAG: YifB family Mg chelatase-like AAA ATPase [Anaerolineae bacterium]|nr:YifB family Mg chelatase-like AAA ATPase [Anaerolineae bacterium]